MASSFCGLGDVKDPEHVSVCLTCQNGLWRKAHPKLCMFFVVLFVAMWMFIFVLIALKGFSWQT